MAIIRQQTIFSWKNFHDDLQTIGDLERLKLVIETMPDGELMRTLRILRGRGRNDYPIEAIWNSILSGIVYEHVSIESLRRELSRNAQLREMCGFDPVLGVKAVPSKSAYNRFLEKLLKHEPMVRHMFNSLVKELMVIFPDFGTNLAGDGKAIHSFGKPSKESGNDKRREKDADWGNKTYHGINKDGNSWKKIKSWFGFKVHLIVEADSEIAVAYKVTKASVGEQPVMRELFAELNEVHPELIERCAHCMLDKGYDSQDTICDLWNKYRIKPVIDIRNMWKDGEKTKQLNTENISYDYKGTVFCHCPKTGEIRQLAYGGFEETRETHKYICPALAYGIDCHGAKLCSFYKKALRISLNENPRIFTPVARSSYKWRGLYNKRTSVERVNSRIDMSFGFERHYIRGLQKMNLRCGLALTVMLAIAVGRLRQQHPELMRSLVKSVA